MSRINLTATNNNFEFSVHFPSGMRSQLYVTRKFYDWVDDSSNKAIKAVKYMVAVPFSIGMLALTPIALVWDIIAAVGYLLNLCGRCFDLGENPGARTEMLRLQVLAIVPGILLYTIQDVVGIILPPVANILSNALTASQDKNSSATV